MEKMMHKKRGKSWGLAMWSGWGSKHDETTLDNQEDVARGRRGSGSEPRSRSRAASRKAAARAQSEPRRRQYPKDNRKDVDSLNNEELAAGVVGTAGVGAAAVTAAEMRKDKAPSTEPLGDTNDLSGALRPGEKVPGSDNTYVPADSARPHNGEVAYPFKLRPQYGESRPVSMQTLHSETDRVPPMDGAVEDKALEGLSNGPTLSNNATIPAAAAIASTNTSEPQRPPLESFVTAREF